MNTRKTIEEIKNKFKTGDIPTGKDYADFIEAAFNYIDEALIVQKVNGVNPDSYGNVETSFKVTGFIPPDVPMSEYPNGASEFYGDYDPVDYPEFISENPSFEQLKAGKICVRTYHDAPTQFAYQQVDNVKDGIFEASFVRIGENGVFGELVSTAPSDDGGSVELSDDYHLGDSDVALSTKGSEDLAIIVNAMGESIPSVTNELNSPNPDWVPTVGLLKSSLEDLSEEVLEQIPHVSNSLNSPSPYIASSTELVDNIRTGLYNTTDRIEQNLIDHGDMNATTQYPGHVAVDGTSITIDSAGVISASTDSLGYNGLDHTASGKLLDARVGKVLKDYIDTHKGGIASGTELGHVKVDGTSITSNANGVISAVPQNLPDATTSTKGIVQLSNTVDSSSNKAVTPLAVSGLIESHVSQKATSSAFGHVKVGSGLQVADGIVSAPEKDYMILRINQTTNISTSNQAIPFALKGSRGVHGEIVDGAFPLKSGKHYRITVSGKIGFFISGENHFCSLAMRNESTNSYSSARGVWIPANRDAFEASSGPFDEIYSPNSNANWSIVVHNLSGTVTIMPSDLTLIIQEL